MQGPILMGVRLVVGAVTVAALVLAWVSIVRRDIPAHEAWMIRAYATGMGLGVVGLVFFPIYIVTGQPPMGLASDILFVASWVLCIVAGEAVARRLSRRATALPGNA